MVNLIEKPEYEEVKKRLHQAILDNMYETRDPFRGYYWEDRPWNRRTEFKTWDSRLMTRQRENEEYEPRQLDYGTGLPMTAAVRKKGESDAKFAENRVKETGDCRRRAVSCLSHTWKKEAVSSCREKRE